MCGVANRRRNDRPSPRQDQTITGRPRPPDPATPSPGSTASPPNNLAKIPQHPPPDPTPDTVPAAKTRRSRSVPSTNSTTGVPCGDRHRLELPPDAATRRPAATAPPPVEPPSHTTAVARYIPAAANRSGGSPGTRTGESGSDSVNRQARVVDPPCAHNTHAPKASPSHNVGRLQAGKSTVLASTLQGVVEEKESLAQSEA